MIKRERATRAENATRSEGLILFHTRRAAQHGKVWSRVVVRQEKKIPTCVHPQECKRIGKRTGRNLANKEKKNTTADNDRNANWSKVEHLERVASVRIVYMPEEILALSLHGFFFL